MLPQEGKVLVGIITQNWKGCSVKKLMAAVPINWVLASMKHWVQAASRTHTHTHNRFSALCPGLPGWAGTTRNIHPLPPLLLINYPYQLPPSTTNCSIIPAQSTASGEYKLVWSAQCCAMARTCMICLHCRVPLMRHGVVSWSSSSKTGRVP